MPDYDPNMKGVLFRNDKSGNEKRPDYRGSAVINNVDYIQYEYCQSCNQNLHVCVRVSTV